MGTDRAARRAGRESGLAPLALAALAALAAALGASGCASHEKRFLALDTEGKLASARAQLERGKWSRAAREYQILAGVLEGTLRYPEVKYGLGRAYAGLKDYPAAEREFTVVLREYAASEWADDALFATAEIYAAQMRPSQLDQTATFQAIEKVREFLRRFPESDRVPEAQALLLEVRSRLARKEYENGRLYLRLGDGLAARTYFLSVVNEYHDTPWSAAAQFGIAESYEKEGRRDEAIAAYRAVVEGWSGNDLARESLDRIRALEARNEGSS